VTTHVALASKLSGSRVSDDRRPNGLGISGGTFIDCDHIRADSDCQKRPDLAGAECRPLHARVGPQPQAALVVRSSERLRDMVIDLLKNRADR
jgi:hypothetical protein